MTGELWLPADKTDLFGLYCVARPAKTLSFAQGSVVYFDIKLDSAGRLPSFLEKAFMSNRKWRRLIEEYQAAALEADSDDDC